MKFINAISLPDQWIRLFAMFIATMTLAACGGGDGFPGYRDSSTTAAASTALNVTAPSAVTVTVGAAQSYSISGGTAPYTVVSSNTGVSPATLVGAGTLNVPGTTAGSAQIVVFDSASKSVTIGVTVVSASTSTTLYVIVPDGGVTIGAPGTGVYTIGGGTPGYKAIAGNPAVATANVVGTTLTITGVSTGTTTVTVFDATLAKVSVTVTVVGVASTPLASTSGSFITISLNLMVNSSGSTTFEAIAGPYRITGGKAPYSISSSANSVVGVFSADSLGNFTLMGTAVGTAQIKVLDSNSNEFDISVEVVGPVVAMFTTPSDATANVGDVLNFTVGGGSPAYHFVVNNTAIASVSPASVTSSGSTFTVTLLGAGSTTVAVIDALGQSATLTVTANVPTVPKGLVLSPSALTIGEDYAAPLALNILNGTAPYRAYTSDLVLSSVSISGLTLTVSTGTQTTRCINTATAYGTYPITVTVVDALGASATSILTIQDNGKVSTGC